MKHKTDGYWTYNDDGDLEYRDPDNDKVLDVVPFAKARSLAAFMLWHIVESFGAEAEDYENGN